MSRRTPIDGVPMPVVVTLFLTVLLAMGGVQLSTRDLVHSVLADVATLKIRVTSLEKAQAP